MGKTLKNYQISKSINIDVDKYVLINRHPQSKIPTPRLYTLTGIVDKLVKD